MFQSQLISSSVFPNTQPQVSLDSCQYEDLQVDLDCYSSPATTRLVRKETENKKHGVVDLYSLPRYRRNYAKQEYKGCNRKCLCLVHSMGQNPVFHTCPHLNRKPTSPHAKFTRIGHLNPQSNATPQLSSTVEKPTSLQARIGSP